MRIFTLATLSASLLATSAWACPDLTGKFLCSQTDDSGSKSSTLVTVTQENVNGNWSYSFLQESVPAQHSETWTVISDGIEHSRTEEGGSTVIETAICQDKVLHVQSEYGRGTSDVQIFDQDISRGEQSNLKVHMTYNGASQELACTKN